MNPIIVATDFSRPSVNAANYAADMAAFLNTDLILVHIIQIPATTFQVPMTEFEFDEIERSSNISLEKLQMELVYRTKNKITVSKEIRYGFVENELGKMSFEKKPFAIVVGRGVGEAFQRFMMGSTAVRVMHHILYPVLIVPENISFSRIKNITIASDLRENTENTSILFAKKFLSAFHASPKIIHVNTSHNKSSNNIGANVLQNSFAEFFPKFFEIEKERVYDGINDFMNTYKTDLLIVVPEKHSFIEAIFQPSESKNILLHSNLPILSIIAAKFHVESRKNGDEHKCKNCDGSCKKINEEKKQTDETHSSI